MTSYLTKSKQRNNLNKQFKLDSATIQLQTVTVKAKKVQQQDSRNLYGADAVVKPDDSWAGYFTVLQALQDRVAGVSVTGSGMNMDVRIRGNDGPPLFLLDGIPTDQDMIMNIPVNDVEAIEVLKGASAAIYGGRGGGGVIAILTKRGNPNYDYSQDKTLGTRIFTKPGYYKARQFYIPRYDTPQPSHNRPDSRSTLYWNPVVQTNSTGKATVSFYNSDDVSTFRVAAEGLSANGTPLVGSCEYQVQKR